MSGDAAAETRESRSAADDSQPVLSNSQLSHEVQILKRQNIELTNQVQNVLSRLGKLDRDVRMAGTQRRH